MWPLTVVVSDVLGQDPLEVSPAEEERPVRALGPDGPTPRPAHALAFGARMGVWMISVPSLGNTSSKLNVYLESRSLISNRKENPASARSEERFPACWVTHAESGLRVAPKTRTRLVASSIAKSTKIVLRNTVSTERSRSPECPEPGSAGTPTRSDPTGAELDRPHAAEGASES